MIEIIVYKLVIRERDEREREREREMLYSCLFLLLCCWYNFHLEINLIKIHYIYFTVTKEIIV